MKCVELKQVFEYKDSDKWLSEEVYGQLLMASITFISYQKQFIKVTIFIINIYKKLSVSKYYNYIRTYQMLQKSTNKKTCMPISLTFNQFLQWHKTRRYQFVDT